MSLKEKGKRLVMCMKVESQEQKTKDKIFKNSRPNGETDQSYTVTPRMQANLSFSPTGLKTSK